MTESDVARIPVGNLRVPRAEFVALWTAAEELCDAPRSHATDWYTAGVATTCEWLANAIMPSDTGANFPASSPATGRIARAYEELIDAELIAAEQLAARDPRPARLARRPGWIEGIVDTLTWAWRHAGPVPLGLAGPRTG